MKKHIFIFIILLGLFFNGCSSKTYTIEIHKKKKNSNSPKKIALFLDGTANDRNSRTNISKLFEIVSNQEKDNLYLFYNEGVGTRGKFLGAATGWGIEKDVKEAYKFLTDFYTKDENNTKIYLFGFSRGAYTARILAGMIYSVGIYDLSKFGDDNVKRIIIDELYTKAYKGKNSTRKSIKNKSKKVIEKWKRKQNIVGVVSAVNYNNTKIEILGLWDTVEALGIVPTLEAIKDKIDVKNDEQNIVNSNERYFDQLCNIRHAFHALSLDDNRAYVFTPIILTSQHLLNRCEYKDKREIKDIVNEVWFSGSHSDIGGESYDKNSFISGVSLNWMIKEINNIESNEDSLFSKNIKVYENQNGTIHDAENFSFFESFIYRENNRIKILKKYDINSTYNNIKIHQSVVDRLKSSNSKWSGYDSYWYKDDDFKECFNIKDKQYIFKNCSKIEVIKNQND